MELKVRSFWKKPKKKKRNERKEGKNSKILCKNLVHKSRRLRNNKNEAFSAFRR